MGFDGNEILENEKRKIAKDLKQQADEEKKRRSHLPGWFVVLTFCFIGLFIYAQLNSNNTTGTKQEATNRQPESTSNYQTVSATTSYSDAVVEILNTEYGNVCSAKTTGFFTKTLVVDWTANTQLIHTIKIMAEIGSVKEKLYADDVRYLQFPNDAGTYNVIDWKTGEKTSISDRAKYYFAKK